MASVEVDPLRVLELLIQKHSKLKEHATTDENEAIKALEAMESHLKDEAAYIRQQLRAQSVAESEEKKEEEKRDPVQIVFHLTGFGKFGNILDNPTTHLMTGLPDYISASQDIASNVTIPTLKVMHVSGEKSLRELMQIRASNDGKGSKQTVYVYLHFGVAASRKVFSLESTAYNCATFTTPDELGWAPEREMIIKENVSIYHEYESTLPIDTLQSVLLQRGYKVEKSTDPGRSFQISTMAVRFNVCRVDYSRRCIMLVPCSNLKCPVRYVCNWTLYNSLHLSRGKDNEYSMFVHVPLFDEIDKQTQCRFAVDLVSEIAKLINWKHS